MKPNPLPVIPQDKANHYLYGSALAMLGLILGPLLLDLSPVVGAVSLAGLVGVLKEVVDRVTGSGHPEVADALATLAGALPVVIGATFARGVF